MGIKGDKHTSEAEQQAQYIESVLSELGAITTKKMFGGHGIFHDGSMFGMVDSKARAYLKAGAELEDTYKQAGFEKHAKMPYYLLPNSVIEDEGELRKWAKKCLQHLK